MAASAAYALGMFSRGDSGGDCDVSCGSICSGDASQDNTELNQIRNQYFDRPGRLVQAVLGRNKLSQDACTLIQWYYPQWLHSLTTQESVVNAYNSIKDLPLCTGHVKRILHELAQVHYLDLIKQQNLKRGSATTDQPEEKLATEGALEFFQNQRFSLFCCSSNPDIQAITLFQQLQNKMDIDKQLQEKKDELEADLKALRS